jgi:TPR repeat protein
VAVNPAKGIEWYEKASSMGDTRAMMQLSNAYASGYGVKISSEKSLYWLKKAADGGSESARRQLDVLQRMKVKQQ